MERDHSLTPLPPLDDHVICEKPLMWHQSISEKEAVQKIIERILKKTAEFREAEMRMKLKDCQGVWVR